MSSATAHRPVDPARWLITPMLAMLVLVFIVPMLVFLVRALGETPGGLDAIANQTWDVISSPVIGEVILKTNWISLLVTMTVLLIAYPIAYALSQARGLTFALIIASIVLPYFTSVIVRTYSWMVLLGRNGLINQALMSLGWIDTPLELMYNQIGIVIGMSYVLLPYLVLTLYAAMKGIDPNLIRAARGLGASRPYVFWHVYFPLSLHGVLSGCLIVFILAIGFFITPALMGGPSDVMIAMLIEREVELNLNWSLAASLSTLLLAVTLVLYAVYYRFTSIDKMMG